MKTCVACNETKPATPEHFFYRNKARGWLSSWCKPCRTLKRAETLDAELAAQRVRRGLKPCSTCGSAEKEKGRMYCTACFAAQKRAKKKVDKAVYKSRL